MMLDSDKQAFGIAITAMLETFGQEATTARLMGYWLGLRDLPLATLESSVATAIATRSKVPVPADLREIASGGSCDARAMVAWADAEANVSKLGHMRHVNFANRLINAVIRSMCGTWAAFCERFESDEAKWIRIEFLKAYSVFSEAGVNGDLCRPLPGLAEKEVVGGEIVAPIPVLIPSSASMPLIEPFEQDRIRNRAEMPVVKLQSV